VGAFATGLRQYHKVQDGYRSFGFSLPFFLAPPVVWQYLTGSPFDRPVFLRDFRLLQWCCCRLKSSGILCHVDCWCFTVKMEALRWLETSVTVLPVDTAQRTKRLESSSCVPRIITYELIFHGTRCGHCYLYCRCYTVAVLPYKLESCER